MENNLDLIPQTCTSRHGNVTLWSSAQTDGGTHSVNASDLHEQCVLVLIKVGTKIIFGNAIFGRLCI